MVIAIIGILAAIVIVLIFSSRDKAKDASAESSLRSALGVAQLCRTNDAKIVVNGPGSASNGLIVPKGKICNDSSVQGNWPTFPSGSKCTPVLSNGDNDSWSISCTLNNGSLFTCINNGCGFSVGSANFEYVFVNSASNIHNFSNAQKDFVASHFDWVEILGGTNSQLKNDLSALKSKNPNFKAIKYTNSIFDYSYKPSDENCYLHNPVSTYLNHRLKDADPATGWGLDDSDPNNCLKSFFLNSINNDINNGVEGVMTDDESALTTRYSSKPYSYSLNREYTESEWNNYKKNFLSYLKSNLPGKTVIFNGLYNHVSEGFPLSDFIAVSDGGLKEGFVARVGAYNQFLSEAEWKTMFNLILTDFQGKDKMFLANCKLKSPLITDSSRMFCFSSFLLIYSQTNPRTTYSIANIDLPDLQYYPEMDINIGFPIETKNRVEDYLSNGVYVRKYTAGEIIVNPSSSGKLFTLDRVYSQAQATGGGVIQTDGSFGGNLSFSDVSGSVMVPAKSGIILLNK